MYIYLICLIYIYIIYIFMFIYIYIYTIYIYKSLRGGRSPIIGGLVTFWFVQDIFQIALAFA